MKSKIKIKIVFVLIFLNSVHNISAQNGNIRGAVIDDATGEYLPGVKVLVDGLNKGAHTDIDGKYDIEIAPGVYNLTISAMLFDTVRVTEVRVIENQVTVLNEVKLGEPVTEFTTMTVSASKQMNTELSVMTLKRKSLNMIDGISAASFRKTGDSDAASAMTRVPGVSLAGGKYVFIRGLGDRYNKTVVNGMDIPGLDPDRNTLQMDIFPTSIIDNMVVNKSFVADLGADFSGGIIDIGLKAFPDKKSTNVSVSLGYNPNYHFNKDYLTYAGGKTDFLGFDDGTRDIPAENNIPFYANVIGNPDGEAADRYKQILKSFNPNMAAIRQSSLMDYGLGFSIGDQKKLKKSSLGYNFMLSYNNSTEFYQEAEFGRYGLQGDPTIYEMDARELQKGEYGVNSVFLSAMAGVGLKTKFSKITFNLLHLQNGESKAGIFNFQNSDQGAVFGGFQHNLEYSQRSLTNAQLIGKHTLSESSPWSLEWKVSPTYSKIEDPDIRFTRYEDRGTFLSISTESGFPERIWRELQEVNLEGKANIAREFKLFGNKGEVKFGGGHIYKERDFNVRTFMINVRNLDDLTGNPDELFSEENLWPHNDNPSQGTTYEATFVPSNPNQFNSNINNSSAFISAEIQPTKKFKTVIGVRSEYYTQRYTGQDQLGMNVLNNDVVLQELGIFPSLNIVYAMTEKQNLRFSYGKTIARPSFKEMSYAEIADPLTGRTFIGGLFRDADDGADIVYWDGDLVSTDIHNLDLRWEIYPTNNQTISVSAFYKKFINPIEIIQFASQSGSFQPRNVGDGQIVGGEVEIRLGLQWMTDKLKDFSFIANVTVTDSRIELSKTEYDSRVTNAREGQTIDSYRQMAGQAPYIINTGLAYNGGVNKFWRGLEVGLFYNMQGQTLQYAGIVDRPDIYTVPFHSLNFNTNKKFGKDDKMVVGVKITNLLNDKKEEVYKSFRAEDQYFSRLTIGTTFSVKFGLTF